MKSMSKLSWVKFHRKVKSKYLLVAKHLWWGDDLDVRFYLLRKLTSLNNKKILDIGCNVGIALSFLDSSNSLYGIDIDDKCIKEARKLVINAKITKASMDKLPFKNKSFDVLVMMNVMPYHDFNISENTKEDFIRNTYNEAYRVLKDDGIIYFSTPNCNSIQYSGSEGRSKASIKDIYDALSEFHVEVYGWNSFKPIFPTLPKKYKFIPPKVLCRLEFVWASLVLNLSNNIDHSKYFYIEATKKLR